MSTKNLTSGILNIYRLKQQVNSDIVSISPVDGDIYYVDLASPLYSECENWTIRELDGEIDVPVTGFHVENKSLIIDAGDLSKLRTNEIVYAYDGAGDFLGTLKIIDKSTNSLTVEEAGGTILDNGINVATVDLSQVDKIVLQTDVFLGEGGSVTIDSNTMPFFCVSGACKLTVSTTKSNGILGKF